MKTWFLNLGVGKKLASIFSLLIILTVLITGMGIWYLQKVNNNVEGYSKTFLPADDLLLNIDRDMQQILVSERTMLITGISSEKFSALKADINENFGQISTRWNKFKETGLKSNISDSISYFEKSLEVWKNSTNQIVEKVQNSSDLSKAEVVRIALKENSAFFNNARNVINDLEDITINEADTHFDSSETSYDSARILLIAGLLVYLVISVLASYFIYKIIKSSLFKTSQLISDLGKGKLKSRIDVKTKDEFGEMGNTLNQFADDLQKFVIGSMKRISEGDFDFEIPPKDKDDEIAPALNDTINTLKELKSETDTMTRWAKEGDLESRGNAEKFKGGYREIVNGLNNTIIEIIIRVREAENVMVELSEGNLTARMDGDYKGNYKKLQGIVNKLAGSLESLIFDVSDAVSATASASSQISSSTEEMASGAQEQSAQTSEVASAVEEMTRTIIETTKNSGVAYNIAKEAGEIAKEGGKVVDETVKGMIRIANVVQKSSVTVKQLGQSSSQIGEIIQVIDDIADQTNLLALNAAIEAARAGEQGRGFAVVADEVRKLAERTTKATKEIAQMIERIQADTNGAVQSIDEGNSEVEKGKNLANEAGASLKNIIDSTDKVLGMVNSVAMASEEQSAVAEQISKNIETISNVTHQASAGTQQIAKSAEDLSRLTNNLLIQIGKFKINNASYKKSKYYSVRSNGKLIES